MFKDCLRNRRISASSGIGALKPGFENVRYKQRLETSFGIRCGVATKSGHRDLKDGPYRRFTSDNIILERDSSS